MHGSLVIDWSFDRRNHLNSRRDARIYSWRTSKLCQPYWNEILNLLVTCAACVFGSFFQTYSFSCCNFSIKISVVLNFTYLDISAMFLVTLRGRQRYFQGLLNKITNSFVTVCHLVFPFQIPQFVEENFEFWEQWVSIWRFPVRLSSIFFLPMQQRNSGPPTIR